MITWLASYPKSGNTWMRALLTNYQVAETAPAEINHLHGGPIAGARIWFDEWAGVEASLLSEEVITRLRPEVYRCMARETEGAGQPLFMKVHDAWELTERGEPIFPPDASAGAVYILRNPLDIAASFANHYGLSLEEAVEKMCDPAHASASPVGSLADQLRQPLRDWSGHVRTWLDDAASAGLSVYLVRYEDLHVETGRVFAGVVRFIGLDYEEARIDRAVTTSAFGELQRQEQTHGFRERASKATAPFFRRGQAGAWREELPPYLAERLIAAHGETMLRFGYLDEAGYPL